VRFPAATAVAISALVFGVNVNTDESLDTVTMYWAESDAKLWLTNVSVPSESPGSAITIRGVAESTILYVEFGAESQKGALFGAASALYQPTPSVM
jgi:hypothetical protein